MLSKFEQNLNQFTDLGGPQFLIKFIIYQYIYIYIYDDYPNHKSFNEISLIIIFKIKFTFPFSSDFDLYAGKKRSNRRCFFICL